jgi:hypothetical protein
VGDHQRLLPSYKQQSHNKGVTEIVQMPGRGHALTIDSGWRQVADTALAFTRRFTDPQPAATGNPGSLEAYGP